MKVSEDDPITFSTQRIDSLLDRIPRMQNFKGKWCLIRDKLVDLRTQLTDFADFPTSTSNPLSLDILHSVSHTLNDAVSLADKCESLSLTEGKLRTQSDIDSLLAKLSRHIRDGEILISSGVLLDGGGGGVCSFSKKEAVRVESRNFITRLQIGSIESKNNAMDSLLSSLQEDDKNVMIAVAQGVVPVLVRLLDSSSLEMKEKTVAAISRISVIDSSKHVLIAEGLYLLNHLLRVLESGSGFSKEKACIALQSLTYSKENARAIGSRGGISSLLEICEAGTPGSQAYAAGVLRNLAAVEETRENFIEENAVYVLIALASSGTTSARENALGCLNNLVSDSDDEKLKVLVFNEGVIECLMNFWDSSHDIRSLEVAVELCKHLASCQTVAEVLVSNGFITRLVAVLSCDILGVRIAAARAVHELGFSSKIRKEMSESGCVTPLIKMLDGKSVEEKESAAKTLSNLMLCTSARRIFRKDGRGVVNTVNLLDHSVQSLDKKNPVCILASVGQSKKCRKEMVAAGACVHLQKLVDVEGAKKLLDNLGRSKIWGVFARP